MPKAWPVDTYRHLVTAAKGAGAKVVLDASGDAKLAVAAGSAACTMPGGEPPPVGLVQELVRTM